MANPSSGHVWRWRDEDPQAIVVLVIALILLAALPLRSCALGGSQGDAQAVPVAAAEAIRDGMTEADLPGVDPGAAAMPAPTEVPAVDAVE